MNQFPPPGWYPNPEQPEELRYWDGKAWTDHRSSQTGAASSQRSTRSAAHAMACNYCDTPLPEGALFCSGCGRSVRAPGQGPFTSSSTPPGLALVRQQLARIPFRVLIPLEGWFREGAWRKGKLGLFSAFALAPFLLLQVVGTSDDISQVAWGFAIYFAVMWLIALAALIQPERVEAASLVKIALFTAIAGMTIALTLEAVADPQALGLVGWILFVGLPEEFAKLLAVYVFVFRPAGSAATPRMYLFAGSVSGLAFGAFEAVSYTSLYQTWATSTAQYTASIVWRLIADSLMHACYAGIAAYFLGLAGLYRKSQAVLIGTGLALASILHGVYDSFSDTILLLPAATLLIFVFTGYVRGADAIAEQMRETELGG